MTWLPDAVVTVGGIDFTNQSLSGVTITYGRPNVWEQARASYATVNILNLNNANNNFDINDSLVITIDDSTGSPVTLFSGKVTAINSRMAAVGSSGEAAIETLTAIGPFGEMARKVVGTVEYPKEYDDIRIDRILTEAGVTIDVVDSPGVYELQTRPANPIDAYSLASYYAGMAFGYLYETSDGKVGYANESRRTVEVASTGYLNIPENNILWRGIESQKTLRDILNSVILTYRNSLTVTASDATSITNYGLIEADIRTELHDTDQAQNIADRYVSLRAIPENNLSSFTIQLDNPNVNTALLDDLLSVKMGTAIQIQNLPNPISHITYQGFVEGWTFTINEIQASVSLITSASTYSIVPIRWQDVDPTTIWTDIDSTSTTSTKTNLVPQPSFEPVDYGALGYFPTDSTRRQRIQFPDEAAFDITGDIDIRVKVSLDDWTPAAQNLVIARDTTGNRTWNLRVGTSGVLVFLWYPVTTALTAQSTVATGFVDGSTNWIRVTMDVDNGAGSRVIQFFTSSDGLNWTQLGSTITTAGTTSIAATAAPIDLGYNLATGLTTNGKIYAAEVRNGINGTVVLYTDIAGDWKPSNGFSYTAYSGQTGDVTNFTARQWAGNFTTFVLTTAQSYSGRGSALMTVTSTGTSRGMFVGSGYRIPVSVGTTYNLSAYLRDVNTGGQFRALIQWYTAQTGGTLVSSTTGTNAAITSTGWTRVTVSGTCPATATHATIFIASGTSVATGTQLYMDAVQFETGSTASTYFDGYASDIPAKEFPALAWTGIAQESSSTADAYWGTKPATLWQNVDEQGLP